MKKTYLLLIFLVMASGYLICQTQTHPTLDYINTLVTGDGIHPSPLNVNATTSVLDSNGFLIVYGSFNDKVDIDPSPFNVITLTKTSSNGRNKDFFIAKYHPLGHLVWGFNIGDSANMIPKSMSVDSDDNIIVGGSFQGEVDFDPDPIGTATELGITDGYIAKYSPSGDFMWKNHIVRYSVQYPVLEIFDHVTKHGGSLATRGNSIIAGNFKDQVTFNNVNGQNVTLVVNTPGALDGFLAEVNSSGQWVRVQKIGFTNKNVFLETIDFDSFENVIIGSTLTNFCNPPPLYY